MFVRGIETIVKNRSSDKQEISSTIAIPLILGFTLMLLMDQVISPHAHGNAEVKFSAPYPPRTAQSDSTVDFDAELSELEREEAGGGDGGSRRAQTPIGINSDVASARKKGMSMTLGLVVHALADGMVLGVSSLTDTVSTSLSMLVFMALVIHKGMYTPPPVYSLLKLPRCSTNVPRTCFFTPRDRTATRGMQEAYYGLRIGHASRSGGFLLFFLFPRQCQGQLDRRCIARFCKSPQLVQAIIVPYDFL